MTYLLMQTFLLLLAAYFLGAFLACAAKKILRPSAIDETDLAMPAPATAVARGSFAPPIDAPVTLQPPPVRAVHPAPPAPQRYVEPVQRGQLPLQPMIETGQRPPPRQVVALIDPCRFERALFGPDPNEGVPRKPIMELRPAMSTWVTGPPGPWPPEPKPLPEPEVLAEPEPELEPQPQPEPPVPVAETVATSEPLDETPSGEQQPSAVSRAASVAGSAVKGAGGAIAAGLGTLFSRRKSTAPEAEKSDEQGADNREQGADTDETTVPTTTTTVRTIEEPAPAAEEEPPRKTAPAASHKFDTSGGDDLQRIRAIDADTERRLKELGVAMFDTIASWTPADVDRISEALGLADRIDREQWIEQAQILAKGGETYYSRNRAAAMRAAANAPAASTPSPAETQPPVSEPVTPAAVVTPPPEPELDKTENETENEADKDAENEAEAEIEDERSPELDPEASTVPGPDESETNSNESEEPSPHEPEVIEVARQPDNVLPAEPAPQRPAAAEPKSVSAMAAAAAAAIAAASASVTRGIRPIEPISPLSKVDPNISIPAKLQDAIREREKEAQASLAQRASLIDEIEARIDHVDEDGDDLKRIRGIGVLIEKRLASMGITRYEQIANWTSGDIDRVSQVLDFKGRIEREAWVEQARILASGGDTEFSRRVDRGDVDTSRDS